ncbi:hypothetical protein F0310_05315 (plasmid) [Borrelia sp. A-FGy1]|nr:hypothetical protein F0310_05315 [Borrelia sp. A-FGy1]
MANLARFHELGTSNLPARSHLYKAYNSTEFQQIIHSILKKAILNKKSIKGALEEIATIFIIYYKDFVLSKQVTPKLKDATIKANRAKGRKHPDTPLVDTGMMISSIEYRHK